MSPYMTVVIPIHNDSTNLALCYRSLLASSRRPEQVIVADDGSTQALPIPPDGLNVHVLRLEPGPQGSYVARNKAIERASLLTAEADDLLAFVDADVAVRPDALGRLEQVLIELPDVAAAFGSYDDTPGERHWVSRYKNLLHHWVHQHGAPQAGTFWTGLGIIRRHILEQVGGFDTSASTLRDIEMGMRLRRNGYQIRLVPEAQGTHLKRWTFGRMLRSDIWDRAIPWTRMIVRERRLPTDLNLGHESRLAALLVWLAIGCLTIAWWQPAALLGALLALAGIGILHRRLYVFMYHHGGALFGLGACALHLIYLLYSSATFVVVALHTLWQERTSDVLE